MKLYFASDIRHARKWIDYRNKLYPNITVVSSWIDLMKDGEIVNPKEGLVKESWENNIKDVLLCDVLVLYAEPGDSMRGSCFEAGVAFTLRKSIVYVGDLKTIGTVECCFHASFRDLDHCLETLKIEMWMKKGATVEPTRN